MTEEMRKNLSSWKLTRNWYDGPFSESILVQLEEYILVALKS
jgi:hypothetical protein